MVFPKEWDVFKVQQLTLSLLIITAGLEAAHFLLYFACSEHSPMFVFCVPRYNQKAEFLVANLKVPPDESVLFLPELARFQSLDTCGPGWGDQELWETSLGVHC